MQRIDCTPRSNWRQLVEKLGLIFHTADNGRPYWDETAYYSFTVAEIDAIEAATCALDKLCLEAVEHIFREAKFEKFQIPPAMIPWLQQSWEHDEHTIYGRFDLLYDGVSPPKLVEFNADTPTALLEAAVIQWFWFKDVAPDADQFNSIHERLIEAWRSLHADRPEPVTFTSVAGHVEDYVTANYLRDVAVQAGVLTQYLTMQQIGWNSGRRAFVDLQERELACVFKLYPWEWMFKEQFGPHLPEGRTRWLEPPWKVLLSNKAILPLLWELNPGHPNLLRVVATTARASSPQADTWPEGANIAILDGNSVVAETPGQYGDEPCIYQWFYPTPSFDGRSIVLGSWLVNGYACGLGIREDEQPITTNTSRFMPHLFR